MPQPEALTISETLEDKTAKAVAKIAAAAKPDAIRQQQIDLENHAKRKAAWLVLESRIGQRYAGCELSQWRFYGTESERAKQQNVVNRIETYMRQLPENVAKAQGILLLGPPGTGKDFLMSVLMREAVLSHGIGVEWVNGVDLFAHIRDAIGGETTEKKLVSQWTTPPVLALSDPVPPRGDLTDFQASMLFRIIDARYRALRPTWVTLNVSDRAEAGRRMGSQVVSRLMDGATTLRCEWQDFRTRKDDGQ